MHPSVVVGSSAPKDFAAPELPGPGSSTFFTRHTSSDFLAATGSDLELMTIEERVGDIENGQLILSSKIGDFVAGGVLPFARTVIHQTGLLLPSNPGWVTQCPSAFLTRQTLACLAGKNLGSTSGTARRKEPCQLESV